MFKYLFKRILFSILALFILMTIVFLLMSLMPNYPIDKAQSESIEEFNSRLENLGLLQPTIIRYFEYWGNFFRGTFGLYYSRPAESISSLFSDAIPYSLAIAGIAFIIGTFIGISFGIISAVYRGKWQDTTVNVFAIIFISVPSFIVAIYLVQLAGVIGLPTQFVAPGSNGYSPGRMIASALMPILSLVFLLASTLTYYTRNEMVDVLSQDYIKTALSKGTPFRNVIFKHALRNAFIPILSVLLPAFLTVLSGSLIIEKFFSVPGVANSLVEAAKKNEVNFVMFSVFFFSGVYFLIQIILDILYVLIDPRIKLAKTNEFSLYRKILMALKRKTTIHSWNKLLKNKNFIEYKLNSEMHKLIIEENLINNGEIKLTNTFIDKIDMNLTTKFIVIGEEILKIKIVGEVK